MKIIKPNETMITIRLEKLDSGTFYLDEDNDLCRKINNYEYICLTNEITDSLPIVPYDMVTPVNVDEIHLT